LVRAAGLPELICASAEEFVERAVAMGRDPSLLQALRERLRVGRDTCVLFDMPGLVGRLEDQYRQMWAQFEKGELPRPDLDNLDVYLEIGGKVDHETIEVQSVRDYHTWWTEMLDKRHRFRPIAHDRRLVRSSAWFP
jgi:hypothetical protein